MRRQTKLLASLAAIGLAVLACQIPTTVQPAPALPTAPPTAPPQPTLVPIAEPLTALEDRVATIYDRFGPSVVNITSRSVSFDFFMRPVPQEGTGSGFIYDNEGHIITNFHVVENAESVSVALADGREFDAEVVGQDPSTDLAVLHIEADNLPTPIPLGDSDQLRVGQFVIAIGNPFGQEGTLTVGVISALGRVIESPDDRFIGEAIQTDAAINPGNSGGPLLDLQGNVIGVNTQIISPSQANAGIGFAVSANTVYRVAPELIASGRYPHPWLSASLASFTNQGADILREAGMDVPVDEGLLVTNVQPGGQAEAAGLRGARQEVRIGRYLVPVGGDIIVAVNDQPVVDYKDLTVYLEIETQVGEMVRVTLIRDGQETSLDVILEEHP